MSDMDNFPFGRERCDQCGAPCSVESQLCEVHANELKKRSKAEMWESVRNGTFDKSGEIAADMKAFHSNKPPTGFGDIDGE